MRAYTSVPTLQIPLENQLNSIRNRLVNPPKDLGITSVLLIGSCSQGTANYRSDIDLLMILKGSKLSYRLVKTLRDKVDTILAGIQPLPIQINFVLGSVYDTEEPAMMMALKDAEVLYDETGTAQLHVNRLKERK